MQKPGCQIPFSEPATACRQFSVKVETIFEDSPVPLQKWLPALWMLINCKNGISSHEMARDLGVTQNAAWFMLHRLRLVIKARNLGTKLGSNGGGKVALDEAFIGGTMVNMHKEHRVRLNQIRTEQNTDRYPNKTAVIVYLGSRCA
jgi:hypothetical protein